MQTQSIEELIKNKFVGTDELRKELTGILDRLPQEGGKMVVTQHGKPQAILMDVESYLDILETLEDLRTPGFIESIYEGLEEIKRGKGISHEQLKKSLKL